jgi:hypothetical protein
VLIRTSPAAGWVILCSGVRKPPLDAAQLLSPDQEDVVVKTIVGSFDAYPTARRVARELMDEGYMSPDIGIMASNVAGDYRATDG